MPRNPNRYYTRSADGKAIYGFDRAEAAEAAALAFGEGAYVVDTLAKGYQPMLSEVIGGELLIAGLSGWDTGKPGQLDLDFIEAAKKHIALAHAFLEKGANINAAGKDGGTALHWAVGGNKPDIVRLLLERGAKAAPVDTQGQTPLHIAQKKNRSDIVALIREAIG